GATEEAGLAAFEATLRPETALRQREVPAARERVPRIRIDRRLDLAVRAQGAHQALRDDTVQGGLDQVVRHAEIEQPGQRARRIVGVQGRQHEVSGQRGLYRHLCGFEVADLADHDDVRV